MPDSGLSLIVRSDRPLLAHAIGALLCEILNEAEVSFEAQLQLVSGGAVEVGLATGERWMCVLLDPSDVPTAREALSVGVWSMSFLSDSFEQFRLAVHALVDGTAYHLPISLARLLAVQKDVDALPPMTDERQSPNHTPLTSREREVLSFVAQGFSNNEIAEAMGISVHTVRTHLSSMATKMEANNRLRLVARAGQLGYPEASTDRGAL